MTGATAVPPILPMLLIVNVAPVKSADVSLPARARLLRRWISRAKETILWFCTFLITGTSRPEGESTATPMLWLPLTMICGLLGLVVVSRCELISGNCWKVRDTALIMIGNGVMRSTFSRPALYFFRSEVRELKSTASV